ncbi:MAG: hypothetical protein PHT07_10410 [Paludibacter sp.]|nr:hypothetical protein [Paludibacter sp.]
MKNVLKSVALMTALSLSSVVSAEEYGSDQDQQIQQVQQVQPSRPQPININEYRRNLQNSSGMMNNRVMDQGMNFQQHKAQMLQRIQIRQNCIASATSREELQQCEPHRIGDERRMSPMGTTSTMQLNNGVTQTVNQSGNSNNFSPEY